jgi:uncharacterized membrane protein (UPF0127 family)
MTTPEEISRGMMGRKELNGCMVFKLKRGYHNFWMKNCLINLDIVFVLNNRISNIHLNCPVEDPHKVNLPHYSGLGDHVIEFPANTAKDFKIGDVVIFGEE